MIRRPVIITNSDGVKFLPISGWSMQTLSFGLWNVMKRDLRDVLAWLADEHSLDVLLLAESEITEQQIADALGQRTSILYYPISAHPDKVQIVSKLAPSHWQKLQTDQLRARMAIWAIAVDSAPELLLTVTHFVSKIYEDAEGQAMLAQELSSEIKKVEQSAGHTRTLIVGDLNMNPFETGVTKAAGLHGVMTKQIAGKVSRVIQGIRYPFFTTRCGRTLATEQADLRELIIIKVRDPMKPSGTCSIKYY